MGSKINSVGQIQPFQYLVTGVQQLCVAGAEFNLIKTMKKASNYTYYAINAQHLARYLAEDSYWLDCKFQSEDLPPHVTMLNCDETNAVPSF